MASSSRPDSHFFDDAERELTNRALDIVEAGAPAESALLHENLARAGARRGRRAESPPVLGSWEARRTFGGPDGTLLDLLCEVPDWDLDLHVPVRVVFGQAYLIAKINFFKALAYGLDAAGAPEALCERVELELGQSVYSKLAEELFTSIVTDRQAGRPVKVAAARKLFSIWEIACRRKSTISRRCSSRWQARNKLRPVIGTTLGTHEFFRPIHDCRDTRFLDYFGQDVPEEQLQAFEEFLFNLGWEQLITLRETMQEREHSAVTLEQARQLLDRPPSWSPYDSGPQALDTRTRSYVCAPSTAGSPARRGRAARRKSS